MIISALRGETVSPSGDHYCIDLVVPSSDHCCVWEGEDLFLEETFQGGKFQKSGEMCDLHRKVHPGGWTLG